MPPLKVLHLRDTFEVGGPGKTILETHRAIDSSRFQLHLGVLDRNGFTDSSETPFVRAARTYGIPIHRIPGGRFDARVVRRLNALMKRLDVDILHAHEVRSDLIGYAATRLRRAGLITTVHGWIGNSRKDRALIAFDRRLLRRFDRIIAVCRPIHDTLVRSGVPASRIRLLHNAIVLDRYHRTGVSGELAQLIGRPVDAPVIASIGRLSREKGHADLLEALQAIAADNRFVAVFAGDGPERVPLSEKARAMGLERMVYFPGYVPDPAQLLEESGLMVLPSHTEGLPNAALEALAMEVPVLATRVGGTPEIITDGVTGRLVPARNPAALAAALTDFLTDPEPWRASARRGRELVEAEFNFTARTRRLEDIYTELGAERFT